MPFMIHSSFIVALMLRHFRIIPQRDSIVPGFLEKFCDRTSTHGFAWYLRTDSTCLKGGPVRKTSKGV